MLRVLFPFLLTLALVGVSIAESPEGRVLVIGIDGTRYDALQVARTPAIDSLIKNGCVSETTRILGDRYRENDTVSGPGWSSFLTGVWADKHGVNDNRFREMHYDRYPHYFTRIKQSHSDWLTASLVDWEPIDKYMVQDADHRYVFSRSWG